MTVGLPGTGIGGLFYLLCALAMPVIELLRGFRKGGAGWSVAIAQFGLAAAMLSVLAAGGLAIDYALGISQDFLETMAPGYEASRRFSLGVVPTFITLGVLAATLLALEIAGLAAYYLFRSGSGNKGQLGEFPSDGQSLSKARGAASR